MTLVTKTVAMPKKYNDSSRPPRPEPKPLPVEEKKAEIDLFEAANQSLELQASRILSNKMFEAFKKIAHLISNVGMSLEEACVLVDIDYDKFKLTLDINPVLQKIITIKTLMYKKDMMAVVSARARNGDDKIALTILERRYPDEFGAKKGRSGGDDANDGDMFMQAFLQIRRNGDSKPLVLPGNGDSVVSPRNSASEGKIERIGDILGPTLIDVKNSLDKRK